MAIQADGTYVPWDKVKCKTWVPMALQADGTYVPLNTAIKLQAQNINKNYITHFIQILLTNNNTFMHIGRCSHYSVLKPYSYDYTTNTTSYEHIRQDKGQYIA